ncbi:MULTISPECIES: kinase [unclassified Streptomyces]|uniref:GHMP family kinase ATP-binding protein n=1 Tax=unclassified Streptomyces TaxID=2593676 RepID=UPI000DBAD81B|nr:MULTISPECIES: kinase [unclassified Streptomyces]MYT68257.1 kinase [Streptomyces sp. SID8367]
MSTGPAGTAVLGRGAHRSGGHHGEILQGVFEHGGRLRRALVTLPCPLYESHAVFEPADSAGVTLADPWRTKARRAAELTLRSLGGVPAGGTLTLTSNIPPSRGFGSSTADVVATIGAVHEAAGRRPSPARYAALAVAAETASDALMYAHRTVLFAHREGEVVEDMGGPLMPLAVVGFGTSAHGLGTDTLVLPPARYSVWEIQAFRPLLGSLRRAVRTGDVALLGRVATASARINQRHLPVPHFPKLLEIARAVGAAGLQVAHSGDVAGLLFDPGAPDLGSRTDHARKRLADLGIDDTWAFTTP